MRIIILILSPLLLLAWINILYLIFNRKKEANQNISILSLVSLYLVSLVPLGILVGAYLTSKKVTIGKEKQYKFSPGIRSNGNLILIIGIASTLFSILNF